MRQLCEHIKANVDTIISLWNLTAAEEPWTLLPEHDRLNYLPRVLVQLAESVLCAEPDVESVRALVEAGLTHGEHRAMLGLPDQVIFAEYDLLRRALWRFLSPEEPPTERAGRAILRIDAAISLATRASIVGLHRRQIEARGDWPGIVDRLVRESSLAWELCRQGTVSPPGS